MRSSFKKVSYTRLNSRQQEIYNFQWISGAFATYGYHTHRIPDDWEGADFIAQHMVTGEQIRALRRRLTNAETILWSRLRLGLNGMKFCRQHPIVPYIVDFVCIGARLIVEVDGATHGSDAERQHDTIAF